jgi:hypothetical protein
MTDMRSWRSAVWQKNPANFRRLGPVELMPCTRRGVRFQCTAPRGDGIVVVRYSSCVLI